MAERLSNSGQAPDSTIIRSSYASIAAAIFPEGKNMSFEQIMFFGWTGLLMVIALTISWISIFLF